MEAHDTSAEGGRPSGEAAGHATRFQIGAEVSCRDGHCGRLARLIVDPIAAVLTHLAVEPHRHRGLGKLVPIVLVESNGDQVRLRCTLADFNALDDAEEIQFLPYEGGGGGGYEAEDALAWPFYRLSMASVPVDGLDGALPGGPSPLLSDSVPPGEVEVRRGDKVHALDGEIGSVRGLAIDPDGHHVTHVLLLDGHLWGRKQIAIPIGMLVHGAGEVRVKLTRQEIHDLPPVSLLP
jgi:hypothetical protein